MSSNERCWHDFLPDQCADCDPPRPPDFNAARAVWLRQFGWDDEAPQVTARVVSQPSTDVLVRRPGHQIPTIQYGHWGVDVDDSATAPLRERRAREADEQRWADIMAVLDGPHTLQATIRR